MTAPATWLPAALLGDGGLRGGSRRDKRSLLRATACATGCRNRCKICAGPTAVFASAAAAGRSRQPAAMLKRMISHLRSDGGHRGEELFRLMMEEKPA